MKNLTVTFTQCTLNLLPERYIYHMHTEREGTARKYGSARRVSVSCSTRTPSDLITVHTIRTAAVLCL
jgi:hypothetical protein